MVNFFLLRQISTLLVCNQKYTNFFFVFCRLLFYTDIGVTPQLIRIRLDGSHRIVITKATDIAAIAIDVENDLVVWVEGHSIFISNIDGDNQ